MLIPTAVPGQAMTLGVSRVCARPIIPSTPSPRRTDRISASPAVAYAAERPDRASNMLAIRPMHAAWQHASRTVPEGVCYNHSTRVPASAQQLAALHSWAGSLALPSVSCFTSIWPACRWSLEFLLDSLLAQFRTLINVTDAPDSMRSMTTMVLLLLICA